MHRICVQVCLFVASCVALLPPAGAQDGREHSIRAYAPARHYIRHTNALGFIGEINVELDSRDARFKPVRGLPDPTCLSLQSPTIRDHYLRNPGFRSIPPPYSTDATSRKNPP